MKLELEQGWFMMSSSIITISFLFYHSTQSCWTGNKINWDRQQILKMFHAAKFFQIIITTRNTTTTIPIIITISTTTNGTPSSSLSQVYLPPLMLDNMLDLSVSKRSTSLQICKKNIVVWRQLQKCQDHQWHRCLGLDGNIIWDHACVN